MSRIIFVHGASSSGKSTLIAALRAALPDPFWHISIDHLRDAGVVPFGRYGSGEFDWAADRTAFFEGFHRSLKAYADAGNDLILEHILDTDGWLETLKEVFEGHDVLFVGLHADDETLMQRETARGDRPKGSAIRAAATIHAGLVYDLDLRSEDGVNGNVTKIVAALRSGKRASSFVATSRL